jgi:hypothetical protein
MDRRAALGLAAGLALLTGCAHDGEWTVEKVLGWDAPPTPKPHKLPRGTIETAERVEQLGRRIIAQNTFTGIDPLFHTFGVPEAVLFHRGTSELYISEGLVKTCRTEAELAAVLCAELGQMVAERRLAGAAGKDRDSIPDVSLPGADGALDSTRAAEVAYQQKRPRPNPGAIADPATLARDLLAGAGFDPSELDRVEPLLKQSDRSAALRKQIAGTAPAPTWQK